MDPEELKTAALTELERRLAETDAPPAALTRLWEMLCELHYAGPRLAPLAERLAASLTDPDELARLAFVPDGFQASWRQAPASLARAAERLARRALELEPEHEEALYLYAQADFLAAINRGRDARERLSGPPVPPRPASSWVRKVHKILFAFEAGEHPLDLFCSMETVPVETDAVVDALLLGLQCRAWRGQMACCEALGRARLGFERIVPALCDRLRQGKESVPAHAADALRELGQRAPALLAGPTVEALIATIQADPEFDVWDQHEIVDACLALAPRAPAALHPALRACLQALIARTRALGPEKLAFYGYSEFLDRAEKLLKRLSAGGNPGMKTKERASSRGKAWGKG